MYLNGLVKIYTRSQYNKIKKIQDKGSLIMSAILSKKPLSLLLRFGYAIKMTFPIISIK
jgi:hypothetical protein